MRRIQQANDLNPDVIGLSIDYDGSAAPLPRAGDSASLSEALLGFAYELLRDTNAMLWLYNGSLRNTRYINAMNAEINQNGCCFEHLRQFVDALKHRHPEFSDRIKLVKLIAEDLELDCREGTCFDNAIAMSSSQRKLLATQYPSPRVAWLDEEKNALHYLQLQHLRSQSRQPLFIFTDDRLDILESAHHLFSSKHPDWLPIDTSFQLIHVVNQQFGTNKSFPLMRGTGIVDVHFKKTVKCLSDYYAAELIRHQKKNIAELPYIFNDPASSFPLLLKTHSLECLASLVATQPENKANCFAVLLHCCIEANRLDLAIGILQNPLNLSLDYKGQPLIEAAAKKGMWELIAFILEKEGPDLQDSAGYGTALIFAITAKKTSLALEIAKRLSPEARLLCTDSNQRNAFFLAMRFNDYDLLRTLLEGQRPHHSDFIKIYKELVRIACHQNNVALIEIIAPYTNAISEDLYHAATYKSWPIIDTMLNIHAQQQDMTLTFDSMLSLIHNTLTEAQFDLTRRVLLTYHGATETEKSCLNRLLDHIIRIHNNDSPLSLTKTLIQETASIIEDFLPIKNTAAENFLAFCRQITLLENEHVDDKTLHTLFVLTYNAVNSMEESPSYLATTLLYAGLLFTKESKSALDAINNLLDHKEHSWDSMISLMYKHYQDYLFVFFGNTDIIDEDEVIQFILSRLPYDKPLSINTSYLQRFLEQIEPAPIKNSEYVLLIDSYFQQPALRQHTICQAAHRALRLLFMSNDIHDSKACAALLARFNAAKSLDKNQSNQEILDAANRLHRTEQSAFFQGPRSYGHLIEKLKSFCPSARIEERAALQIPTIALQSTPFT